MSHLWTASVLHGPSRISSTNTRARPGTLGPNPSPTATTCRRDFLTQSQSPPRHRSVQPLTGVPPQGHRHRDTLSLTSSMPMTCCGKLSGLDLGPKQIERTVHKIGQERVDEQDEAVERFNRCPWPREVRRAPKGVTAPELAVVMTDGGRYQMHPFPVRGRQPCRHGRRSGVGCGRLARTRRPPQLRKPPRTRPEEAEKATHWREDKIGLLLTMTSKIWRAIRVR